MVLSLQKFREIIFQLLYSQDFSSGEEEDVISFMMGHCLVPKTKIKLAQQRQQLIAKKLSEIDQLITEASKEYSFERIPRIERNILRLGVYELLYDTLPPKVAIAEAIRLSRKFATPEGATFVNAILDRIFKEKKHEHLLQVPSQQTP